MTWAWRASMGRCRKPHNGQRTVSSPRAFPKITPAILTIDETLDIGSDTRTPVDDADYQMPFRFTGTINKVSFKALTVGTAAETTKLRNRVKSRTSA